MKKILIFSALALTTLSFGQNIPSYVPTNGLVGWYPFNGNANDESGNGNDGVVNGVTLTTDRNGKSNSAYNFDGIDDFIEIQDAQSLKFTDEITISFWMRLDNLPTDGIGHQIITKQVNSGVNQEGFHIVLNNGNELMYRYKNGTSGTQIFLYEDAINFPSLGSWFHVVAVTNNSEDKLYINNILVDYNSPSADIGGMNISNLIFGKPTWTNGNASLFNGGIDDIAIYNRALTQQELTALYSSCSISATTIGAISSTTSGNNITMSATSSGSNLNYTWETNPINNGWQEVVSNSTYSGNGTSSLSISNLTLANHQQPFRVIASDNSCSDTSDVAYITLTDTCINTTSIAVTDTLIMDISLAGVSAPNDVNTMKIYPNPTNDIVNIDNGNYTLMTGYSIKIMTAIGQEMFSSSITSQTIQVPVSQLGATGNYFINVYDNNQVLVESKVLILE